MKTVTYQGPKDPADRSTIYEIADGEKTVVLPLEEGVDVSNEVANQLKGDKDHKFSVSSKKGGDAEKEG